MAEYTFDPRRAQQVLEQLEQVDAQIKAMLSTLDENSRRNLAAWSSDTKDAYAAAKASWDASANAMPVALANARNALMQIAAEYQRMEAAGSGMFGTR